MKSSVAVAAVVVLLLSSCSVTEEMGQWFAGPKEEEWEPIQDLEYPASVSEVAWRWEVPEGNDTYRVWLLPVAGGVGAVLDDGIIALSAETGGEMWSYQVSGSEVFSAGSNDGRYFVLQILDSEDEDAPPRMVILDLETGEPVEDYFLSGGADSTGKQRGWLSSINDERWVTASEGGLTAYALGSDHAVWEVKDVVECDENMGSIDGMVTGEKVTVVGTTCYEQPEDEDEIHMTEGQDFISGLVGIDMDTGKELWRWEDRLGLFPAASMERNFTLHENDLLTVDYPYDRIGQIVNPETGDVTTLDEGQVLWSNDDGSRFGVWDQYTQNYRIEDLNGEVYEALEDKELDIADLIYVARRGGDIVGLEKGALEVTREVPEEAGQIDIAAFQGFESTNSVSFSWSETYDLRFVEARSVPGAVAVSYLSYGETSGIIGIR